MHNDKFPLGFLGPQTIKRASDIRWAEDDQSWGIWFAVGESFTIPEPEYAGFDSYETARDFEVAVMNEAAKQGMSPIDGRMLDWAKENR